MAKKTNIPMVEKNARSKFKHKLNFTEWMQHVRSNYYATLNLGRNEQQV